MRANPVIMKELRGRMRGWRAVTILVSYLIVLCFVTWLTFLAVSASASGNSGPQASQIGKIIFSVLVSFQLLMVALLTPAFTAGSITTEREQKTYDLLMTTLLPARSVIFGKLGSALAWVVLLILAAAPLESLAFLFGGVSPEEVILSQVVMLVSALLFASIGIFWSSRLRSSLASNVLTYGTIMFQMLLVPFLYVMIVLVLGIGNFNDEPAIWYISGIVLSSHPLIAMGISESFYLMGHSLFIYTNDELMRGHTLLVVSPWLLFCIEALCLSAVLILLSIRSVQPVRAHKRRESRLPDVGNIPPAENVSISG